MRTALLLLLSLMLVQCRKEETPVHADLVHIKTDAGEYNFIAKPAHIEMANSYYLGPNQDFLCVVMETDNGYSWEMFLTESDLRQRPLPYKFTDEFGSPHASTQLRNNLVPVDTMFGPNDDINFSNTCRSGLEITVLAFESGILTGTVRGPIYTSTRKMQYIESGFFTVRIANKPGV